MKIEVLGAGCPKCHKLEAMVKEAVAKLGVNAEVSHVYEITEIINRGIMMTPALVIDGKVKLSGKLPSENELNLILTST
ncbi:TM0996/MTH895 family glutaredoxin-like protein [Candidatus Bathyarchaeota archaeon]|nr:TM0996/MTH895 family glutaredoxin-like protein [Candidatus Bathyarchaeota archaeon]